MQHLARPRVWIAPVVIALCTLATTAAAAEPESPCSDGLDPVPFGLLEVGEVLDGSDLGYVGDIVADAGNLYICYICGSFDSVDGVPATGIARWDGSSWHALYDASGMHEGIVQPSFIPCTLAIGPDGRVYVGGDISSAGDVLVANIATWDPVNGWDALPTGGIGGGCNSVEDLASSGLFDADPSNDFVEVVGSFTTDGAGNPLPNGKHAKYHPASDSWIHTTASLDWPYSVVDWGAVGSPSTVILGGWLSPQPGSLSRNLYADPMAGAFGLERETPGHVHTLVPVTMAGNSVLAWSAWDTYTYTSTTHHPSGPLVAATPFMGYLDTWGYAGGFGAPDAQVFDFLQPGHAAWKTEALFAGGNFTTINGATMSRLGWYQAPSVGGPVTWHPVSFMGDEGVDQRVSALETFDSPLLGSDMSCVWVGGEYTSVLGEPAGSIGGFCCPSPPGLE